MHSQGLFLDLLRRVRNKGDKHTLSAPVPQSAPEIGPAVDYLAELAAVITQAKPVLSPAMTEVNRIERFHSEDQVKAVRTWIDLRRKEPGFDAISLLYLFATQNPHERAPLIAAALEHRDRGEIESAVKVIDQALSRARNDLYTQHILAQLYHIADDSVSTAATAEEYLKDRFCGEPFRLVEFTPDGSVFVCCPDWLPVSIGNIHKQTARDIWESPAARELRDSIIDRSFRFCSKTNCVKIANRTLPAADSQEAKECLSAFSATQPGDAGPMPREAILSHDRSCNLACPSCRKDFILANKEQQAELDVIARDVVLPILRDAEVVKITGSGDPFGSNHFRNIIKRINRKDFPRLYIDLHTNGQLFDERAWRDLEMDGLVRETQISIDAARAETYKVVRRGGDFGRLLRNLDFVHRLRQAGEIKSLSFSFVVQAMNFREMPEFVRLGMAHGADVISFAMIRNWAYTEEEFSREFVGSPRHPEHEAFLDVMKSPELEYSCVLMSGMSS